MTMPASLCLLGLRTITLSALRSSVGVFARRITSTCRRMASPLSNEDALAACSAPPPETKGFFMQQTMMRIKDPKRSLDFYTRVMGMTLLRKFDFADDMNFSLYFLAYVDPKDIPKDKEEATKFCFSTPATIELTHNWGTETQEGEVYHNGNKDPKGFGHIGIIVPDVSQSCKRFEDLGITFIKKPDGGKMPGLAFIQDPDGYWIEILNPNSMAKLCN